jgi:integrase/recombinase XerC
VCGPLRFEDALLEAMLDGWARQQQGRMLCRETIVDRRRLVCRLRAYPGVWLWEWCAEHLEKWIEDLASSLALGH